MLASDGLQYVLVQDLEAQCGCCPNSRQFRRWVKTEMAIPLYRVVCAGGYALAIRADDAEEAIAKWRQFRTPVRVR